MIDDFRSSQSFSMIVAAYWYTIVMILWITATISIILNNPFQTICYLQNIQKQLNQTKLYNKFCNRETIVEIMKCFREDNVNVLLNFSWHLETYYGKCVFNVDFIVILSCFFDITIINLLLKLQMNFRKLCSYSMKTVFRYYK